MKRSLTYLLLIFALLGCTKVKSSKWVVADIQVVDAATGDPVEVLSAKFSYVNNKSGTATSESIPHIGTNSDGHIIVKEKVKKDRTNLKMEFMVLDYYGSFGYPVNYEVPLSKFQDNVITVETHPVYPYLIHLTNVNCTGVDDTVWVHSSNNGTIGVYTGCVDTALVQSYGATWYSAYPEIYLSVFAKKSGVTTSVPSGTFNLIPGELTDIQIDY